MLPALDYIKIALNLFVSLMDPCDKVKMKWDLCERLYVDDVDQSEKEGQPVLHSRHVGQQAALRKYFHHWEKDTTPKLILMTSSWKSTSNYFLYFK